MMQARKNADQTTDTLDGGRDAVIRALLELAEEMLQYVPEYFAQKHGFNTEIARLKAVSPGLMRQCVLDEQLLSLPDRWRSVAEWKGQTKEYTHHEYELAIELADELDKLLEMIKQAKRHAE